MIRILLGLLRRDAGSVSLFGADPRSDVASLHRRLAYVPGEVALWPRLTGGETIDLLGSLRGDLHLPRVAELVDAFHLDPTKQIRNYSKGNRQKVGLISALSSDAELLILDEPTSGLDPLMESVFQQHIRRLNAEGRTVLLSSHILAEVEALCDRVTIIRSGKTVETGTLAELRHVRQTRLEVVTRRPVDVVNLPGTSMADHVGPGPSSTADGHHLALVVENDSLDAVLQVLVAAGIESIDARPPSLEELFLRLYEVREQTGSR
jgi:ABC-2 type transport system ATP-binding protein